MTTVIERPAENSPFLPGTFSQFAWDSTSLGYLKECPRKYFLTMIEGWRSKDESVHLTFGIHFHKALETFDLLLSQGVEREAAIDNVFVYLLEVTKDWNPDHNKKNRETLLRSVIWYLEEYKDDPAKTIILSNGKPAVELSFRFDSGVPLPDGSGNYLLSGHMDRLVQFGNDLFVMDRKTTGSTIGGYFFDQFSPDNQMSLYTLAGRVVYDMPISGVIIDAAQIAVGFTAFGRGITMRSADQIDEWLEDFGTWMRVGELYSQSSRWPMNEKSCNNYGGCVFKGICNKSPSVHTAFLKTDFEQIFWNPLETR